MAQNQLERQLAAGVRAARQGNKERARELLEAVLKRDRENEQAWIWMASIVNSTRERRICLERVLKINPTNRAARAAINSMVGVIGAEGTSIDIEAISSAAKNPLPSGSAAGGGQARGATGPLPSSGGGQQNLFLILVGVAVVLVLVFLATLLPSFFAQATPTVTVVQQVVEATEEATEDPNFTPLPTVPTATFTPASIASIQPRNDLPTEAIVPTETEIPTEVPTEAATISVISNYDLILLVVENNLAPTLYEVFGDGTGLKPLTGNLFDIDVHPNGVLAYTEEIVITLPTPTPSPTVTPDPRLTPDPNDSIIRTPQPRTAIISKLFLTSMNNPLEAVEISNDTHTNTFSPSISPDGQQIAFASDADGDDDIYIYDIPSRTISRVTNNSGVNDIDPDWSADGSQMVFASDRESPGRYDLYILTLGNDVEGSVTRITDTRRGDNRFPQWSPLGGQVAYLNQVGNNSGIRIVNIQSGAIRELTFQSNNIYSAPSWTADGIYVVYTSDSAEPARQIFFVNPETLYSQQIRLNATDVKLAMPRS